MFKGKGKGKVVRCDKGLVAGGHARRAGGGGSREASVGKEREKSRGARSSALASELKKEEKKPRDHLQEAENLPFRREAA